MTDTGQVPGEGLPESAGMGEQPGVPAPGAYTYLSETAAEDGVTAPMMLTPLRDDDKVAITVEPASGSEKPTTQPIMLADLPET